jgi:hypothetical protein
VQLLQLNMHLLPDGLDIAGSLICMGLSRTLPHEQHLPVVVAAAGAGQVCEGLLGGRQGGGRVVLEPGAQPDMVEVLLALQQE